MNSPWRLLGVLVAGRQPNSGEGRFSVRRFAVE